MSTNLGTGMPAGEALPPYAGIALANVRARLALLHDVQGEFTAGVLDGLYQVRISLPVQSAPARVSRRPRRHGRPATPPSSTPPPSAPTRNAAP